MHHRLFAVYFADFLSHDSTAEAVCLCWNSKTAPGAACAGLGVVFGKGLCGNGIEITASRQYRDFVAQHCVSAAHTGEDGLICHHNPQHSLSRAVVGWDIYEARRSRRHLSKVCGFESHSHCCCVALLQVSGVNVLSVNPCIFIISRSSVSLTSLRRRNQIKGEGSRNQGILKAADSISNSRSADLCCLIAERPSNRGETTSIEKNEPHPPLVSFTSTTVAPSDVLSDSAMRTAGDAVVGVSCEEKQRWGRPRPQITGPAEFRRITSIRTMRGSNRVSTLVLCILLQYLPALSFVGYGCVGISSQRKISPS